jgi:hypothetical protein
MNVMMQQSVPEMQMEINVSKLYKDAGFMVWSMDIHEVSNILGNKFNGFSLENSLFRVD